MLQIRRRYCHNIKSNQRNRDETLTKFSKQTTSIKFTIEQEQHSPIYFWDLTIHRERTKLEFGIWSKSTKTHT
jgi:hypothetical protein